MFFTPTLCELPTLSKDFVCGEFRLSQTQGRNATPSLQILKHHKNHSNQAQASNSSSSSLTLLLPPRKHTSPQTNNATRKRIHHKHKVIRTIPEISKTAQPHSCRPDAETPIYSSRSGDDVLHRKTNGSELVIQRERYADGDDDRE